MSLSFVLVQSIHYVRQRARSATVAALLLMLVAAGIYIGWFGSWITDLDRTDDVNVVVTPYT